MTDADKIKLTRIFIDAIRKGNDIPEAKHPANRAIAASLDGMCSMIEACLDGDPARAMAFAEDMPMRMQLAAVKDGKS